MIKPNTQAGRLLAHLESGKSIDRLSALVDLGIFELASRIGEIRDAGYLLNKVPKKISNRFGESCRVIEYSLIEFKAAA
ncbi:helix-turn-helix domain-containing protein [Methylophilus flavus]|uniref:Helix-turn-helix domain-containing protein n=1 Tax=Methylophilus flavus TaxID=640084 RepID=A0ABW3PCG1_9PROT